MTTLSQKSRFFMIFLHSLIQIDVKNSPQLSALSAWLGGQKGTESRARGPSLPFQILFFIFYLPINRRETKYFSKISNLTLRSLGFFVFFGHFGGNLPPFLKFEELLKYLSK